MYGRERNSENFSQDCQWKIMTHPNPVGWKRKFELLVRTRKKLGSVQISQLVLNYFLCQNYTCTLH